MTEPVTPTPISPLPPAPLITDTPEVFDDKAFPFAASLVTLQSQVNTQSLQTNQNAVAAKESASGAASSANAAVLSANSAGQSATDAGVSATAAGLSATAAASSEESAASDADWISRMDLGPHSTFPTTDNQGRPIIVGAHFLYTGVTPNAQYAWDGAQWLVGINVTAGVTQISGQSGALELKTIGGESLLGSGNIDSSALYRVIRTSNSQLGPSDKSKLIDITAGTFTQTFAAAATIGDGWFCYLRNSGTGDITLDPNASELIDGLASYVMYPGECRLVQCDGVALRTVVLNAFYRVFTASGNFTKPPGYGYFEGLLWAAGASGAAGSTSRGGGGGGACAPIRLRESLLGALESVTIGAGGPASAGNGIAGGNSSFGTLAAAYGGGAPVLYPSGGGGLLSAGGVVYGGFPSHQRWFSDGSGVAVTLTATFGGGSSNSAGTNNAVGQQCVYGGGAGAPSDNTGYSHNSVWGGAGGGTISGGAENPPGVSKYGGSGGAASIVGAGTAGSTPGGGGGASQSSTSGAGGRGELRIWGVI